MGLIAIRLSVFVHATEDSSKVRKALYQLIPAEAEPFAKERRSKVKGHYGNPIEIIEIEIRNPEAAEAVLRRLAEALPEEDKKLLEETWEYRVDEHKNLYIRIDKQRAYLGEPRLAKEGESVIRLQATFDENTEPREYCKQIGLIP